MNAQNPSRAGIPVLCIGISGVREGMKEARFFHLFDASHVNFEHVLVPSSCISLLCALCASV